MKVKNQREKKFTNLLKKIYKNYYTKRSNTFVSCAIVTSNILNIFKGTIKHICSSCTKYTNNFGNMGLLNNVMNLKVSNIRNVTYHVLSLYSLYSFL